MGNLTIWESVQQTDPAYTKAFTKGGGFSGTAINAVYQIRRATELWGPLGEKWGYEIIASDFVKGAGEDVIHILRINFRHPTGAFCVFGQTTFIGKNKNGVFTDEEAPKKSLTDAITKALSMLGFSADVFMGLYDDNKYVNDLRQAAKEASAVQPTKTGWVPSPEEEKFLSGEIDIIRAKIENEGALSAAAYFYREPGLDEEEKLWVWNKLTKSEKDAVRKHKGET